MLADETKAGGALALVTAGAYTLPRPSVTDVGTNPACSATAVTTTIMVSPGVIGPASVTDWLVNTGLPYVPWFKATLTGSTGSALDRPNAAAPATPNAATSASAIRSVREAWLEISGQPKGAR
jgi:hypothetical protein